MSDTTRPFDYTGTGAGQMSNAYVIRCNTCGSNDIYECFGRPDRVWAERAYREKGWSKTKTGWRCWVCTAKAKLKG